MDERVTWLCGEQGASFVARFADDLECTQLGLADGLLRRAEAAIDERGVPQPASGALVPHLCAALRDVIRIAESRGARLPVGGVDGRADTAGLVVRRWPPQAQYVGAARRLLRQRMDAWGMAEVADTATLILSELHGNAVRHARHPDEGVIETRFERLPDGRLRIEVHDADSAKPERLRLAAEAEAGRGLSMVDALTAGRWGVSDREGPGKAVWAECPGPA